MRLTMATARPERLLPIAALGLSAALVAGCAGSSSPGKTAATSSTTPGATTSAGASDSPGPGGSAGPTSTPTGPPPPPLTFHGVSHGAWLWVRNIEPRLAGVARASYDGGTRTLRVFFQPGATSIDRRNVKSIVKQAERLAAKGQEPGSTSSGLHETKKSRHARHRRTHNSPSPSPTPTPFPTHRAIHHPHGPTPSPSATPSSTSTH